MTSVSPKEYTMKKNQPSAKLHWEEKRESKSFRRVFVVLIFAVVIAGMMYVMKAKGDDELSEFKQFPHTYLRVQDVGYDETKIVIWKGGASAPPMIRLDDGSVAWPCYVHPNESVVPRLNGKPLLIPLIYGSGSAMTTPSIPPHKTPLPEREIQALQKFQIPEGQKILEEYSSRRRGMGV